MRPKPQEMWEKGVPLSEAILEFSNFPNTGDSLDKIHYLNLCEPAQEGECKPDNPDYYKYVPKEPWFRESDRKRYKKRLCEHLCNELYLGNLTAIGTQVKPVKENSKKEILNLEFQFLLNQNLEKLEEIENLPVGPKKPFSHWDDDVFQGRTVQFEDVRIFDPNSAKDETISEKRKRGRPSTRLQIEQAYEECKENKEIDFGASLITAIKVVIKRLRQKYPENFEKLHSGFGRETIRQVIRSDFQANVLKHKGQ